METQHSGINPPQIMRFFKATALMTAVFGAAAAMAQSEPAGVPYTGPVIDMHMHTATNFGDDGSPDGYFSDPEEYRAEVYKRFEKYNVVKAVVSGAQMTEEGPIAWTWHKRDPDRIVPGILMPGAGTPPVEAIRELYEQGQLQVIGEVGSYYLNLRADDPAVMPYFALAEELGLPIGYHLLPGGAQGTRYEGPMFEGIRAANANPIQFEDVLVAHPNLRLYIMHAGWPYVDELKAMMYTHPQFYVDISAINWIIPRAEFHSFLEELVDAGHGKRIMFGSDPLNRPGVMDIGFEAVDSASFLTDEQKADIFYYNAARFLQLSEEEVADHWAQVSDD